jgi:hypothetical protein
VPSCERCLKSRRECQGYERASVFVNRTARGLERRAHLEEARPRQQPLPRTPETDVPRVQSKAIQLFYAQSSVPFQIDDSVILSKRLQNIFLERFCPSNTYKAGNPFLDWIHDSINLDSPDVALSTSIRALTITKVGRYNHDDQLVNQGKIAYGQALRALQSAISRRDLALKDETLAAGQALAIYELNESTSDTITSYYNHVNGVAQLLLFRGPAVKDSVLGQDLTQVIRFNSVSLPSCSPSTSSDLITDD